MAQHLSITTEGRGFVKEEWGESSFSPLAGFKLPHHGQRSATGLHSATFDPARRFSLPMEGYHQQHGIHGLEPIHSRTPSLSSTFASEEDSFGSPSSTTSSSLPDAPFIAQHAKSVSYPLFHLVWPPHILLIPLLTGYARLRLPDVRPRKSIARRFRV